MASQLSKISISQTQQETSFMSYLTMLIQQFWQITSIEFMDKHPYIGLLVHQMMATIYIYTPKE